jgi:TolB-like protein
MYQLLTLAFVASSLSASTEPCRVVVLDLKGVGLTTQAQQLLPLVTESMALEVANVSACKVISEADIKKLIELEADKQSCGTDTDSCMAEIGAALGAERVVAGNVALLGDRYLVQARLLDTQRSEVLVRVEESSNNQNEPLLGAARNAARRLFGLEPLPVDVAPAATSQVETKPISSLLWAGAGIAVVGIVVGIAGALGAGIADAQLADAANTDKDAARSGGLVGLGAAGLGSVVALGGIALTAIVMMGE